MPPPSNSNSSSNSQKPQSPWPGPASIGYRCDLSADQKSLHSPMTYCVGMLLDAGLVFLSYSRTNAGVDQISTFRKVTVF